MASPKSPQSKPRRTPEVEAPDVDAGGTPDVGAVSALDVIRTNNDLTRKKGGSRGSIDTQDPGYVNDQLKIGRAHV